MDELTRQLADARGELSRRDDRILSLEGRIAHLSQELDAATQRASLVPTLETKNQQLRQRAELVPELQEKLRLVEERNAEQARLLVQGASAPSV